MILSQWEAYYEARLAQIKEFIAERGADAIGPEYNFANEFLEQHAEAITFKTGERIYRSEDDYWNLELSDKTVLMNYLDGKSEYCTTAWSNFLYQSPLLDLEFEERLPTI